MSRQYHDIGELFGADVATLLSMSRHCYQCRDIEKEFSYFMKFLLVYSILFLQIQFMLVNLCTSILRNVNSSTNNNTQIFNPINSTYNIILQRLSHNYVTKEQ